MLRAVVSFFTGLEHEEHPSVNVGAVLSEKFGRTDQHRDVRVVTTGVHRTVDP